MHCACAFTCVVFLCVSNCVISYAPRAVDSLLTKERGLPKLYMMYCITVCGKQSWNLCCRAHTIVFCFPLLRSHICGFGRTHFPHTELPNTQIVSVVNI